MKKMTTMEGMTGAKGREEFLPSHKPIQKQEN
jgi:hypothetical protein